LSQVLELTLENPAYGGDAIGHLPDGRAVFVPFGIPGEMVKIRVVLEKKNYARGELLEVLEPSPFRIQPRCLHFAACGGCHYQHISYEQQLVLKRQILQDQLQRIGGLENPPVEPVLPSADIFNYRNQIRFHLSREHRLGFIHANQEGVLEIKECHLPQEKLNEIWPLLDVESGTDISSIGMRIGYEDDVILTLESPHLFTAEFNVESLPVSVVHISPESEQILAGTDYTIIQVKGRNFKVSAQSFFQVNTLLAEQMVAMVEKLIPSGTALVLELYSGVGLFSAFIAGKVGKLVAVEASESAGEDFIVNLDEFENVDLYQGKVEDILPSLNLEPSLVLVDPPRTGLNKNVLERIISLKPDQIIYISCDPATLARDSRILIAGGYDPTKFLPFDYFCQTYHIEILSLWDHN
jgi:23S rRNA (uracil1939-C5)-methyltransferase